MLEPREADLLVLFLLFVVLPLVTYIFLGKWSEVSERTERISLLAQLAAEEAFRAESMTTTLHIPVRTSPKTNIHQCARCSSPATTRCSGCKSVRYCSGKCQIIHWRQAHKLECQRLEGSAKFEESINQRVLQPENFNSPFIRNNTKEAKRENASSNKPICISSLATPRISAIDSSHVSSSERTLFERNSEVLQGERVCFSGFEEASISRLTSPCSSSVSQSIEASNRHKLGNANTMALPEETCKADSFRHVFDDGSSVPMSTMHESHKVKGKGVRVCIPGSNCSTSKLPCSGQVGRNAFVIGSEFLSSNGNAHGDKFASNNESEEFDHSAGRISLKSITKPKSKGHASEPRDTLSPLSTSKASKEYPSSLKDRKGHVPQVPQSNASMPHPAQGSNAPHDSSVMNKTGLKKLPDPPRQEASGASATAQRKMKVLFSYEEFMKYFQCETWDISPRGLLNCGNR
ncbi:hypothetical protein Syun_028401 [Stephania yunnanensis]|uniref:MYND-type domain-containing protein n=1 Tax=Stephania yunnanensis TaxID=152371 RepID=A0AAP0EHA4_9MAGN